MRVAVVFNAPPAGEREPALLDVLNQARLVGEALGAGGHVWRQIPFGEDREQLALALREFRPRCVFNLVEEVEGRNDRQHEAVETWERLGLPYTGSSAAAIVLTNDKPAARARLAERGLPVPPGAACGPEGGDWSGVPGPWILKPAREDGSLGIDEESVVRDAGALPARLAEVQRRFAGQPVLVEHYVAGREFNLALLGGPAGPEALPPAEIRFREFPPGKERVVGYRAKWLAGSFEYRNTEPEFDFPESDRPLLEELSGLVRRAWEACGLNGYGRVDLRVDEGGRPWIIEVNANPCLAPEAGLMLAAARAGLSHAAVIERILEHPLVPAAS